MSCVGLVRGGEVRGALGAGTMGARHFAYRLRCYRTNAEESAYTEGPPTAIAKQVLFLKCRRTGSGSMYSVVEKAGNTILLFLSFLPVFLAS